MYFNTLLCIATGSFGWEETCIAIQTNCIVTGLRKKGWAVLQYDIANPGHGRPGARPCACDTAMPASTHAHDTVLASAALRPRYGARAPVTRYDILRHGRGPRPRQGCSAHDTARHARACVPSWASWVFCAPDSIFDLIFDSVLFPSHRLDPVHEHCSSQNV